jgi:hypothetical protein
VFPEAIEPDVERNVLTAKAQRRPATPRENVEMQVADRPLGMFSRATVPGRQRRSRLQRAYANCTTQFRRDRRFAPTAGRRRRPLTVDDRPVVPAAEPFDRPDGPIRMRGPRTGERIGSEHRS